MKTIHAVFENGVFRPTQPVELPEASHVEFEPRLIVEPGTTPSLDDVYSALSRRFNSGEPDVAARHNEHQP
ncbi:MAG: antitoxin family protein [Planctomycetaceae bacterium]|nr:antitoxin family protein [Planctomycetaceae bacterium]